METPDLPIPPQVDTAIGEKQAWVDKQMGAISSTPLHANTPITAQQVRAAGNGGGPRSMDEVLGIQCTYTIEINTTT